MIGLFYVPPGYVAVETGLTANEVSEWTTGPLLPFVTYDPETEEILVHAGAKHQLGPGLKLGDNRLKHAETLLSEVRSAQLVRRFLDLYADWPLDVDLLEARSHPEEPLQKPLQSPFEARAEQSKADPEADRASPDNGVGQIVSLVNAHRTAAGLTPLRGGDRTGRSYIRARIRDYDFETVERVAKYAPEDSWIRDGASPKLGLHAIFSPKSFPMLLDRLDDGQGGGEVWGT